MPKAIPEGTEFVETENFGKLYVLVRSPKREVEVYCNEGNQLTFIFFHQTLRVTFLSQFVEDNDLVYTYFPTHLEVHSRDGSFTAAIVPLSTTYTVESDVAWGEFLENGEFISKEEALGEEAAVAENEAKVEDGSTNEANGEIRGTPLASKLRGFFENNNVNK